MKRIVPIVALICCSVLLFTACQQRKAEVSSSAAGESVISDSDPDNVTSAETASTDIQEANKTNEANVLPTAKADNTREAELLLFPGRTDYTKSAKVAIDRNEYGFDFYIFGFDGVEILYKGKRENLKNLVENGNLTPTEIVNRCKNDQKAGRLASVSNFSDGGSVAYEYKNYSVIKKHSLDGDNNLIIAPAGSTNTAKFQIYYSVVKNGLEWSKYCNEAPLNKTVNGNKYSLELSAVYIDANSRVVKRYENGNTHMLIDEQSGVLIDMWLDDVRNDSDHVRDYGDLKEIAKNFVVENCNSGSIEFEKLDYHAMGYSISFKKTIDGKPTDDWMIVCLTNVGEIYMLQSSRSIFD